MKKAELSGSLVLRQLGHLAKIRRFPPPSHGGFGFIGRISLVFTIQHDLIKKANHVNMENRIVKIIFFSGNWGQEVQTLTIKI